MTMEVVTGVCEKNAHPAESRAEISQPRTPSSMLILLPGGHSGGAKKTPISAHSVGPICTTLNLGGQGAGAFHVAAADEMGVFSHTPESNLPLLAVLCGQTYLL